MARVGSAIGGVVLAAGLVAFACDDPPVPPECTDIPAYGCPVTRAGSCSDPQCESIYACRRGNIWEVQEKCPSFNPDAGTIALRDAGKDAPDATTDASPDPNAPPGAYGGPGCGSLQDPDCTVGLALGCTNGCCGCEDLFVCQAGAWELWGVCADGVVRETP